MFDATETANLQDLRRELDDAIDQQRRSDCMARIQSDAVQLALDLVVRESDVDGFFRVFIKPLVEESECRACGVWLLEEDGTRCDLWMAFVGRHASTAPRAKAGTGSRCRGARWPITWSHRPVWRDTLEYSGDDERLPPTVREFNRAQAILSVLIAPLALAADDPRMDRAGAVCRVRLRDAVAARPARRDRAAGDARAVSQPAGRAEPPRGATAGGARGAEPDRARHSRHAGAGVRRDPDAAAGGAADGREPAAAGRVAASTTPSIWRARIMVEARRSVGALRPQSSEARIRRGAGAMVDLARRTTDVPVDLSSTSCHRFDAGVEREIIGIAQEALTNAVRHARARRIVIRAAAVRGVGFRLSVADDGRGIAGDRRARGFGMTSMQERAERIGASLTIVTAPRPAPKWCWRGSRRRSRSRGSDVAR